MSTPSSSPFANPPPSSTEVKSSINGMAPMPQGTPNVIHSRPPMPFQPNQSPSAGLLNRPLMPSQGIVGPRPPMPSQGIVGPRPPMMPSQAPSGNPIPVIRPPPSSSLSSGQSYSPQANPMPQMTRPPLPQTVFPGTRPSFPMPQNPPMNGQTAPLNRPPMSPQGIVGPRPPIPSQGIVGQRPPMPSQGIVGPRPLMPPQGIVGQRPLMPQSQSVMPSSSPFASPPSVTHSQSIRPQTSPAGMRPPVSGQMRPPMPVGNPPMRPPIPTENVLSTAPMRPQMPFTQSGPNQQSNPAPTAYNGQSQIGGRPPMPMHPNQKMPQHDITPAPYGSQVPPIVSPSMRYPSGPGYIQQQQTPSQGIAPQNHSYPQPQPAGYPQSAPSTQQTYPSYPQASNMANTQQYPPQGFSGANGMVHPPAAPKVNPAAIPSVVAVLEADELRFKETGQPFYTFSSLVEIAPPLPTTKSVSIVDDGNSSPQFVRVTMNHIPVSEEVCHNTRIPLSLLIQPFSSTPQGEIPLVDFGVSGPLRCNRCRAYINSHVQFIKGGRYFVCNMCSMANDVPEEYYANLDMSGKRIDLDLRSELKFGTVDFVASKVTDHSSIFAILFSNFLGIFKQAGRKATFIIRFGFI